MKLKPSHQRALRTTLRVTLAGVLGACGGGGGSAASKTAPTTSPALVKKITPATEAECRSALTAAYPDGDPKFFSAGDGTSPAPTDVSDADLAACCQRHSAALSTPDYRKLGCCSAHTWDGAHCTPWGPPMPPAMIA